MFDKMLRDAQVVITPGAGFGAGGEGWFRISAFNSRANVEEVKKLMIEAQGFYDTARYDLAFKRYEQILNIDPYNIAARKCQERVNLARDNYAMQAYDETRSRAIWKVDKGWENPVRKYTKGETTVIEQGATTAVSNVAMINKLNRIIIPKIEFRDATVREAIDFLKQKSRELDVQEPDPTRRGVNIVLKLETSASYSTSAVAPAAAAIPGIESTPAGAAPAAPAVNPSDVRITLSLSNIPLMEALRYITNLAGLKVKIDPYAVAIVPLSEPTDVLVTKEYKVPPGFISNMPGAGASGALNQPASATAGGAKEATGAGSNIVGRQNAKDFLMANGVQFPEGASANFLAASSKLIVRNTQPNLDLIDTLVDAAVGAVPSQVDIESKFVEIQQTNTKELSFDWLLGQFNIPGSQRIFGGGGTSGTSPAVNAADYPFTAPGSTVPVGGFPVTAGNRSGNLAISGNAIDALLAGVTGGASSLAPSVFGLAGVFTDPQFQLVIRALNQKKGVDLLSAPRVTTKSGNKAVIEIIREFRYPTEFTPPQIPQNVGGSTTFSTLGTGVGGVGGVSQGSFPVTPTTPTSFETRNTGVTLEVEPVVGPDGYTIDLNLVPQVVEFEGFINYGSPIQSTSTNALGISITNVITPNVINQPIFSTRKVTTSVSIWDGQTVTLGGLMREDVQHTEDKVPLLGDIPGFGRLFRSSTDQHIKRNLIIFVTAIDESGRRTDQRRRRKGGSRRIHGPAGSDAAASPARVARLQEIGGPNTDVVPILGITGGIATGKSNFTNLLRRIMPSEVFDADECARDLTANNPDIKQEIISQFGAEITTGGGEIDRAKLRKIVFAEPEKRTKLEAILHPVIRARWMQLAQNNRAARSNDWLFVDIPLLFETHAEEFFDAVVVVVCSASTQRQRLLATRGLGNDMAGKMIASQMDLSLKIEKADHVIWNNSSLLHLEQQTDIFAAFLRHRHG